MPNLRILHILATLWHCGSMQGVGVEMGELHTCNRVAHKLVEHVDAELHEHEVLGGVENAQNV